MGRPSKESKQYTVIIKELQLSDIQNIMLINPNRTEVLE